MYLQDRMDALRKDIDKHGKVKTKKGQQVPPAAKVLPLHSSLFSLSLFPFFPFELPFPPFLVFLSFLPFPFFPVLPSLSFSAFISA